MQAHSDRRAEKTAEAAKYDRRVPEGWGSQAARTDGSSTKRQKKKEVCRRYHGSPGLAASADGYNAYTRNT